MMCENVPGEPLHGGAPPGETLAYVNRPVLHGALLNDLSRLGFRCAHIKRARSAHLLSPGCGTPSASLPVQVPSQRIRLFKLRPLPLLSELKRQVSRWHVAALLPVNYRLALCKSPQKGFPSNRKNNMTGKPSCFISVWGFSSSLLVEQQWGEKIEERKKSAAQWAERASRFFNLNMQWRLIMSPAHREVICSLGQQTSHTQPPAMALA